MIELMSMTGRLRGQTMAKYRITMEWTTQLSREVEADSSEEAKRMAEAMDQEYQQGDNTHVTGTERRRSVELLSAAETRRL
jgi:hypothetical protein